MDRKVRDIKLGIICPGIGNQQRGFETFYLTLFNKLKGILKVHLIKGSGARSENEHPIPHISRDSFLLGGRNSSIPWGRRYKLEQISFFLPLLFHLYAQKYDIVQLSDPDLALMLNFYRRNIQKNLRIIYTNAVPNQNRLKIKDLDFIQQTSRYFYEEALQIGVGKKAMRYIPYGIEPDIFKNSSDPRKIIEHKKKLGIANSSKIVLSAGSIDSTTKRMDHLIKEIAQIKSDVHLIIAGQRHHESDKVKEVAKRFLGNRVTFLTVAHDEMPKLYSLADIFALCSLEEGFGFVFIEAMSCSIPVIAHDHPSMRSLISDAGVIIDMRCEGRLANAVEHLLKDDKKRKEIGDKAREHIIKNFSWDSVLPRYLEMYKELYAHNLS